MHRKIIDAEVAMPTRRINPATGKDNGRWRGRRSVGILVLLMGCVVAVALCYALVYGLAARWGSEETQRATPRRMVVPQVLRDDAHPVSEFANRGLHASVCALQPPPSGVGVVRILCVGDSITYGNGSHVNRKERDHEGNFPVSLQHRLNAACRSGTVPAVGTSPRFKVSNLGSSGRTLLNGFKQSYRNSSVYQQLLLQAPRADVMVVMLGTNDSKLRHWRSREAFEEALVQLVLQISALNPLLTCLLVTPPPALANPKLMRRGKASVLGGIRPVVIRNNIRLAVMGAAERTGCDLLDLHGEFESLEELHGVLQAPLSAGAEVVEEGVTAASVIEKYFHDGVHPTVRSHEYIAELVAKELLRAGHT